MIVHLQDIVDALEMQLDESSSFLDLDTGRIETVSNELLRAAEEPAGQGLDLPAWQQQEWEMAKRIVFSGSFQKRSTKFDVHEWAIMRDFSGTVESERIRRDLLNAIHGSGAFRHFKEILRRQQIEEEWFAFRAEALKQIAVDWCEEPQIAGSRQISRSEMRGSRQKNAATFGLCWFASKGEIAPREVVSGKD